MRPSTLRRSRNGDVRKFLWLSLKNHVALLETELQEEFDRTGVHVPMETKLRMIVDDYCRAHKKKKRKGATAAVKSLSAA